MATGIGLYRHCGAGLRRRIPARYQRGRPGLDRVDRVQSLLSDSPARSVICLWERRAVIASVSPEPDPVAVAGDAFPVGCVADCRHPRHPGSTPATAGRDVRGRSCWWRSVRASVWLLLAPLLFLFFLVPSGAFLVPTLQKITAQISIAGLESLHIPVFSDGFMIEIPEGTFEIAEACAGLRFLIASIVFGCFFAVVMYQSFIRRAVFIALSRGVPIAANGMRALGIIVLAHLEGSAAAVEADHVLYGWFFFTLVIIILIAIGMTFAQKIDRRIPIRVRRMVEAGGLAICDRSPGGRSARGGRSGLCGTVECAIPGFCACGCPGASDSGALASPI